MPHPDTLRANYHCHTCFCDGRDTPEEMVREAIRRGFLHLGISGHMDPDIFMDMPAYLQELHRLQDLYADEIEILCGVELDNAYDPASAAGADYIIGSTHFLDCSGGRWNPMEAAAMRKKLYFSETARPCRNTPLYDSEAVARENLKAGLIGVDSSAEQLKEACRRFFGGDFYALSREYYRQEAEVCDRLHPDFIGHFDLVTRFNDAEHFLDETDPRYLRPALETMEYLVQKGVPFEINCGAVNRGRKKELYPRTELLKALHDFGGEIVISSDAHQKELLDGAFSEAVQQAIACGFTHTNILLRNPAPVCAPSGAGSAIHQPSADADANANVGKSRKVVWKQLPLDRLYT